MNVDEVHSIDDLFERVKDYDLVLTVEAPLSDALNNRLDRPILGKFAETPRRLALQHQDNPKRKRDLFIHLIQRTDQSWKQISYLLDNIINCWQETGDLKNILTYDEFNSKKTKEIINIINNTENIYSSMEKHKISKDKSVAVVALHQFNELDKKVLPDDYDIIDSFSSCSVELSGFKVFNSTSGVIGSLRSSVSELGFSDVAVVMDPKSRYQSLVESTFQANNIPYMIPEKFTENNHLRTLLSLIRSSFARKRLRLRDVQPILRNINRSIPTKHNNQYLKDIQKLGEYKSILQSIQKTEVTYEEIIQKYEEWINETLRQIRENLEELNILDKEVNEGTISKLEHYLQSFDITVDSSVRGVLIADPKTVSYIDRSIVFYLGMDSTWTHRVPEKPWIDQAEYEQRNLKNFKILLQNGEQQHYLVQNKLMNEKVTPSFYFNEILKQEFNQFKDLPNKEYQTTETKEKEAFTNKNYNIETETVKSISQSDLNRLYQCPKQYLFSNLVDDIENQYLKKGNLFHDFAEFYLNHPKYAKKQQKEIIQLMIQEMKPHIDDLNLEKLKTEFKIGINNIKNYIERNRTEYKDLKGYKKFEDTNSFSDHYDKPIDSHVTEMWFENSNIGGKGIVDLIKSKDHLVDYKSGRRHSQKNTVRNSKVSLLELEENPEPNFQAILYLLHHRAQYPNRKLRFTFYYFMNNMRDQIAGNKDPAKNLVTITYHPRIFDEFVSSREAFDYLVEGSKRREKTLKKLEYENYKEFFNQHEFPQTHDKDEVLETELTNQFINYSQNIVGEYTYVEKACKNSMKQLIYLRNKNYFKEDLDEFEKFLQEWVENLNQYREEGFPVGDVGLENIDRDLEELVLHD